MKRARIFVFIDVGGQEQTTRSVEFGFIARYMYDRPAADPGGEGGGGGGGGGVSSKVSYTSRDRPNSLLDDRYTMDWGSATSDRCSLASQT